MKLRRAFTLMELMLAVTIFAMVSIAIYATFNSGISVWKKANKINISERKRWVKLEKLKKEIRQTFLFKTKEIVFEGEKTKITFASLNNFKIESVNYDFAQKQKVLARAVASLQEVLKAKKEDDPVSLIFNPFLDNVEDVSFSYFYYEPKNDTFLWKDEWKEENSLPQAVKFSITYSGNETITETVFIPVA